MMSDSYVNCVMQSNGIPRREMQRCQRLLLVFATAVALIRLRKSHSVSREEEKSGTESMAIEELPSSVIINSLMIGNSWNSSDKSRILINALFWLNASDHDYALSIVGEIMSCCDEILHDGSFWSEYEGKMESRLIQADPNKARRALAAFLALCNANRLPQSKSANILAFLQTVLVHSFQVLANLILRTKTDDINLQSIKIAERMTSFCMIAREGIQAASLVARSLDKESPAHVVTQSREESFIIWVLDILARLMTQAVHLPAVTSTIHCLAEDIEYGEIAGSR